MVFRHFAYAYYGALSWFHGESATQIMKFGSQTVVYELLLGQCCNSLFTIIAV